MIELPWKAHEHSACMKPSYVTLLVTSASITYSYEHSIPFIYATCGRQLAIFPPHKELGLLTLGHRSPYIQWILFWCQVIVPSLFSFYWALFSYPIQYLS